MRPPAAIHPSRKKHIDRVYSVFPPEKLSDVRPSNVDNRDSFLFDDEENSIASDDQVSDRTIQFVAFGGNGATMRH